MKSDTVIVAYILKETSCVGYAICLLEIYVHTMDGVTLQITGVSSEKQQETAVFVPYRRH